MKSKLMGFYIAYHDLSETLCPLMCNFFLSDIHGRGFEVEALVCIYLSGLSKLY